MRIITLNLNGIRSATKKGFLPWLQVVQPDVICLQELKAQADNLTEEMQTPEGYYGNFHYAEKKGYSGVGIYSKQKPDEVIVGLGIEDIDREGRYLECRFGKLSVISLYLPSGSSGDERQNYKFSVLERFMKHVEKLINSGLEVVICGDWNIAHQEIDLKNYKGNKKNSGFLPGERAWMTDLFDRVGWVDVYRLLYPDTTGDAYTWWSNRGQAWANNVGWRIDYQIATPGIAAKIKAASVYKEKRFSDHAPLVMDYED
jgi:exodeoxyribonuclease-3